MRIFNRALHYNTVIQVHDNVIHRYQRQMSLINMDKVLFKVWEFNVDDMNSICSNWTKTQKVDSKGMRFLKLLIVF